MTTDANDVARDLRTSLGSSQERTIGQLVAQATQDVSVIVRKEIQLAKTEVSESLGVAGKGAGLLVGAGVLALYALGLLLICIALVIAIWLPAWAGFLIVAVVLFIVSAILALLGRRALRKVNPRPERAITNAQETIEAVKSAGLAGQQHAKAIPPANAQVALDERPASG